MSLDMIKDGPVIKQSEAKAEEDVWFGKSLQTKHIPFAGEYTSHSLLYVSPLTFVEKNRALCKTWIVSSTLAWN